MVPEKKHDRKALLLCLGLDNKDGHTRITKGENFCLMGGSDETHERMTETAVKFNEKLNSKGKTLDNLSRTEFVDLLSESAGK